MTPEERAKNLVASHNDYRKPWVCGGGHGGPGPCLDTYRAAIDIAAAIRDAVVAEREACINMASDYADDPMVDECTYRAATHIAALIRARGNSTSDAPKL